MLVPAEGLRLQAGYAYLKSEVVELETLPEVPAFFPGSHLTGVGFELPYTPRHKLSIDASYRLPIDESMGEITLGTTFNYTSRQFYQGASSAGALAFLGPSPQSEVYNIRAYSLWNLNASWNRIMGSPVDLSFFMTNVANKHYDLARNLQATSGFVSRYIAEPQDVGLQAALQLRRLRRLEPLMAGRPGTIRAALRRCAIVAELQRRPQNCGNES